MEERRKNIRLEGYDYTAQGAYFVTICSRNRENLFGELVGGDVPIAPKMNLSLVGGIIEKTMAQMPAIKKYVIMPNHIHFIAVLDRDGSMGTSTPTQGLPSLVRFLKRQVSVACGESVWQRNYYEHVIRNEQDYLDIWNYIDSNPARRQEDAHYGG